MDIDYIQVLKDHGPMAMAIVGCMIAMRNTTRFMFNEELRPDGRCKGPLSRLINNHIDNLVSIGDTVSEINKVLQQNVNAHSEVMKMLGILEDKIERFFVEQKRSSEHFEGMITVTELLLDIGKQLGVDVTPYRVRLEKVSQKKRKSTA